MSSEHTQLQIQEALDAFVRDAQAVGVHLSDRSGASLSLSGDLFRVDPTRFAASLAGLLANAHAVMRPLGREQVDRMHVAAGTMELLLAHVKPGFSVAVVFDQRTTLGVVRWRLDGLVDRLGSLLSGSGGHRVVTQITDEEIENLFS